MNVRLLVIDDIERYIEHFARSQTESGVAGAAHFHVYGRAEPYDQAAAVLRERRRWTTPTDEPGWRRAWGLILDDERMVGHLYFEGGSLGSELHRVNMGMGVQRSHHRQGGGRRLLQAGIEWARAQPGIDWIDLGVFEENAAARALYAEYDFVESGRTPDRYRVDGHRIDDISMTLQVEPTPG